MRRGVPRGPCQNSTPIYMRLPAIPPALTPPFIIFPYTLSFFLVDIPALNPIIYPMCIGTHSAALAKPPSRRLPLFAATARDHAIPERLSPQRTQRTQKEEVVSSLLCTALRQHRAISRGFLPAEQSARGNKKRPLPADNGADARRWGEEEFSLFYLRASASSAGKFRIRLRLAALCSLRPLRSLWFNSLCGSILSGCGCQKPRNGSRSNQGQSRLIGIKSGLIKANQVKKWNMLTAD